MGEALIGVGPTQPANVFEDCPVALGRLVATMWKAVYRLRIFLGGRVGDAVVPRCSGAAPPLLVGVGMRVTVSLERNPASGGAAVLSGVCMRGIVARVNGDATCVLLRDDGEVELSVTPERIVALGRRRKLLYHARLLEVVSWLRPCMHDPRDAEAVALILFCHGWRVELMHLLQTVDVSSFVFVSSTEQGSICEKAQWEREHRGVLRCAARERLKDRDFRYALAKYKGAISCIAGVLVVTYVFTTNLRAYRREQRDHQLQTAIETLSKSAQSSGGGTFVVGRKDGETVVRRVLTEMLPAPPRIVVFTGSAGSGASVLWRSAVLKEGVPHVCVDVRATEDTLRSVVKALGVGSVDVCGDLLDFVEEACRMARAARGETPLLLLRLREGSSLQRVYRDVAALAFDRRVCHVVMEVPAEALSMASAGLPRLDLCVIPAFSREEAFAHTQRAIDPVSLSHFVDVVGTSSSDVDELIAAVRQRRASAAQYTNARLLKAMRQLQATCASRPELRAALQQLSACPYDAGQHSGVDAAALHSTALVDIVLYDPVADAWRFRSKLFHTASRCCWL
nr:unnamed protein product [Leishmania braziliensis]